MWIDEVLFNLSSGQAHPLQKHVFGHVTSLIGQDVVTPYSESFPRATSYMCQIWREPAQWLPSYKQ